MKPTLRDSLRRAAAVLGLAVLLTACPGGGGGGSPVPTTPLPTYTVGGTVSGLAGGDSVTLLNNGNAAAALTVTANGAFTFSAPLVNQTSYLVTVQTQPTSPVSQNCWPNFGSGAGSIAAANVTTVDVECSLANAWTWQAGSDTAGAAGDYGTQGIAVASNVPGARVGAVSWTDASGNFWLFGGCQTQRSTCSGTQSLLNDLWEYSPSVGTWTWQSGASTVNAIGVYGGTTPGTATASTVPGARWYANTWIDASGNLWMFGGLGYDSAGTYGNLNDLWEYTPASSSGPATWTWVAGSNTVNATGIYGTLGTGTASTVPGARNGAVSWIDSSGNLWLFGGAIGFGGSAGFLNDLWQYTPGTGWTWMSGAKTVNADGVYGGTTAPGTASATTTPGAREYASSWIDSSGNLWLIGGYGYDSAATLGYLNDVWEYSPSAATWTWINGLDTADAPAAYGTPGTASASNYPGTRYGATTWVDASGNVWLFGGFGDAATTSPILLNELWEYTPPSTAAPTGQWTFVSGTNGAGVYGMLGVAAATNEPGARVGPNSWTDANGNVWMFGGQVAAGTINDLWQYVPTPQ